MVTVTAEGGVLPLARRAPCPCVPCIAAQAVARVGVRMAGWARRTGLRSWWCDGVRGQAAYVCVCVQGVATRLGQPWPTRQGREGEGAAAGIWHHLASGIWHAATQLPKKPYTSLLYSFCALRMRLEICLIGCGVGRMSCVPDYCPLGISGGRVTERGCSGCMCKIT